MKGVLMKLGQMASYVDEDMPQTFRAAMCAPAAQRSADEPRAGVVGNPRGAGRRA